MTSIPHEEPAFPGLTLNMTASAQPRIRDHTPDADAAVIKASLRDPERFAEVFDRHAAVLHRYVVRRLGPDHAEDVVAEAFTRAFEKRHKYAFDRTDALPWLYGIATNIIGSHRRAEVRGYRALARTGEDPVAAAFDDQVVAQVTASATRERLAAALAKLGRGERDVLLLIAWGDLTYEETAQALDVPVGTVRSRLSRSRRKIVQALGGSNPTDVIEEAR
ncbi:RNA polymerase sigma factor [Nonomuraea sp. NEAU-A123]|uniref:RNA polymerase sigma factor n=1 Tax=Nonomuraea sp. NEAU-A123 TaxID=2839649 RepID=UPI0027E0A428|nr:RNA polymerase sigma factor [Nonomuraea sp. NEAU-A123]